ncbi:MAG: DUF4249 domain-containing protein [Pricia sp.]
MLFSKSIRLAALLATLALILFSCEDVIELDLTEVPPQVVIEGFVTDREGPYIVRISRTADFYEPNSFPSEEGALVQISDDQGNEDTLTETAPGIYETNTLQGQLGATYTLEVQLEGTTYTATSTMPERLVPLDSISADFEEESLFFDEGYYATAFFNDPPDVENYYRLQVLVNGEVYFFVDEDDEESVPQEDINFWLTNDRFTDGNLQDYEFPHTLQVGDTMDITLQHLDESTFDYYRTLVDVINGGGVAPSNPITNWDNGALGYFGAFSVTENSVQVRE